jgi:WD40 repeat protein/energy-coupling factor transporter ATP-binding protein EcfA2/cell division protein FtsL
MRTEETLTFEHRLPYPGLRPFSRHETDLFFGREEHVDHLLEKLSASRFLSVVGSSGCGKSSLIRAGLIPSLEGGFIPSIGPLWFVAEMRPGSQPLKKLARTVFEALYGNVFENEEAIDEFGMFHAMVRRGPEGLIKALGERPMPAKGNLLIYVDQFEEIFRYRKEGNIGEAEAFIALLLSCAAQEKVPVYIMLSMRSEFIGNCDYFNGLPEKINECQYLVPRLTRELSREAIVGPARVFGGDVSPELANSILNDMGNEPDQLPLMQHLLMRIWLKRTREGVGRNGKRDVLSAADATDTGGFARALSLHADEVYEGLKNEDRRVAEVLFRCLSDHNMEKIDIRRPVRLGTVANVASVSAEKVMHVVNVFRHPDCSFLTPVHSEPLFEDSVIDISHESLIRQWGRMHEWVKAEIKSAEIYQSLEKSAVRWQNRQASLWRGPELFEAREWKKEQKPNSFWAERYGGNFRLAMRFLEAGGQRESTLKIALIVSVVILVVLTANVIIYLLNNNRRLTESEQEANKNYKIIEEQYKNLEEIRATLLQNSERLQSAYDKERVTTGKLLKNEEVLKELNSSLERKGVTLSRAIENAEREKRSKDSLIAINKIRQKSMDLASKSYVAVESGEYRLAGLLAWTAYQCFRKYYKDKINQSIMSALVNSYNEIMAKRMVPLSLSDYLSFGGIAFVGGRKPLLASFSSDGGIELWNTVKYPYTLKKTVDPSEGGAIIQRIAGNPETGEIATGYLDGRIILRGAGGSRGSVFRDHGDAVTALSFSADGSVMASAGLDECLMVRDLKNDTVLKQRVGKILSLDFHPAGNTVVCGLSDGAIQLWNYDGAQLEKLDAKRRHDGAANCVRFGPDGTVLASGGEDGLLCIWRLKDDMLHLVNSRSGHKSDISSLTFNFDGSLLATGSFDRKIKVWELYESDGTIIVDLVLKYDCSSPLAWISFDPRRNVLVSVSVDTKMHLWNIDQNYFAERIAKTIDNYLTRDEWNASVKVNEGFMTRDSLELLYSAEKYENIPLEKGSEQ